MQTPLHLPVLLILLWLLALRLPGHFSRKNLLEFGLLCALASRVVGSCPRVVGDIVHCGRRRVRTQKEKRKLSGREKREMSVHELEK